MGRSFVDKMNRIVSSYGIPKKYIEIEFTESAIFDNEEIFISILNDLHEKGFSVSMDDFGSGFSSLGLLKNISVDVLKIDKSFFDDNSDLRKAKIIISSIFTMATQLSPPFVIVLVLRASR